MQPRRIARELALLSLSQLNTIRDPLENVSLPDVVLAAVRTLATEVQDALETAAAEIKRGSDRILTSETRATDVKSASAMVQEAIELTQSAINKVGTAVELPEFIQLANQTEVRDYTLELLGSINTNRAEIDNLLNSIMVDWQLSRLPGIDRDILRIAVTEIWLLNLDEKVAINEAVELAKRYSDEEGPRFINGVLRRVSDHLKASTAKS